MHIGLTIFPTDYSIQPTDLAMEAEARGFESLWLPEHTHIPTSRKSPWPGGAELPKYYYDTYDPFLSLAAAAAVTKKIKLATGICLVVERDPIHTAKEVSTIDRLSGRPLHFRHRRRLERRGDGQPRHRLCDALQADARAHRGDEGDLGAIEGEISRRVRQLRRDDAMAEAGAETASADRGRRRLSARPTRAIAYGDGWIPIGGRSDPLDVLPQFRQMAKDAGRDPASLSFDVFGAPRDLEALKRYRDAGVDRAIFMLPSKSRDEVLPMLDQSAALVKGL